ncbi:MAG: peptidase T [Treponemataceae bacterium]|nr:MAG: peptidase T [Treponemataceae bacterium]
MIDSSEFKNALLERFIRYVKIWTTADSRKADQGIQPSFDGQRELAALLQKELAGMGIDTHVTEHCYVCGRMSASKGCENSPVICYSAHMDTSEAVSGKDVKPVVTKNYDGKPIALNANVTLDPAKDKALAAAKGQTIIHADGTTLLGSDDKAGVAVIMTALDVLRKHPEIPHGEIEVIFSPDEETGHGMDNVPLSWMKAKQAYTLDGDVAPMLEIECFNAYKTEVTFTGISRHTGSARPEMVNAVNLAADFVAMLPRHESPETTDNYLGFYAPMHISGNQETSSVEVLVRDFDSEAAKKRLKTLEVFAQAVNAKYKGSAYEIKHTPQYANMREGIQKDPRVLDLLIQAVKNAGLEPEFKPIRGGTDGSRLTEMGIPTPNIFAGSHNFHSRTEWSSLEQMSLSVTTLTELAALWSKQ